MSVLKETYQKYFFAIFLGGFSFLSLAFTPANREYQLKAVFLYNFTQFIEWPSEAFIKSNDPFVIGILGTDNFGNYLDGIVVNEKVNGHPIIIRRFNSFDNKEKCHILFVSQTDALEKIASQAKEQNTLIVGETSDCIQKGGMITFVTKNNKINFQINPQAAKDAGLVISSKLLRLAEIVNPQTR